MEENRWICEVHRTACIALLFFQLLFVDGLTAENLSLPMSKSGNLSAASPVISQTPSTEKGVYITRNNVSAFRDIFLSPLESWVSEGKLALRIADRLNFAWAYSADWNQRSQKNMGKFAVDSTGNLQMVDAQFVWEGGAPFVLSDFSDKGADPRERAYKILWASQYVQAISREWAYEAGFLWMGLQSTHRHSDVTFYRRYGARLHGRGVNVVGNGTKGLSESSAVEISPAVNKTLPAASSSAEVLASPSPELFFQQVFRFLSPAVVARYATVTWRYEDARDDDVWVYSPVVARSRQLFMSNRSDLLLGGTLSLDDCFVWDGKIQAVDAKVIAEKRLLVPMPSLDLLNIGVEELSSRASQVPTSSSAGNVSSEEKQAVLSVQGNLANSRGTMDLVSWNAESRQFGQFVPWMPTSVSFVARDVWILELSPKDPFTNVGRQLLVIDRESLLPIYKVVYGLRGKLQRFVVGGWGLASSPDGRLRLPVQTFVLGVDREGQRATAMSTRALRILTKQENDYAQEQRRYLVIQNHTGTTDSTSSSSSGSIVPKE